MYDDRRSLDRAVLEHLRGTAMPVFKQTIRTNTKVAESYGLRQTICDYAPTSWLPPMRSVEKKLNAAVVLRTDYQSLEATLKDKHRDSLQRLCGTRRDTTRCA